MEALRYRDERAAFFAGELFSIETDESMLPVLEEMQNDEEEEPYLRRAAFLYQKEMRKTLCIPKDEFVALEEETSFLADFSFELEESDV